MNTNPNPAGYVRLALYILSALVGLAAVVINVLGYTDLSVLLGTVAGGAATITGGTATFNLPKAPDQDKAGGFLLDKALPAILDIASAARAYQSAVEYEARHSAEEDDAPGSVMSEYAAMVRGDHVD